MNYMLTIITSNSTYTIIVSKDIGEIAKKEWREWNEDVARNMERLLEVEGISNSADRAERSIMVKFCEIEGIDLSKLF